MIKSHAQSSDSGPDASYISINNEKTTKIQQWFAQHVTLDGVPYTLDEDQIRAVIDGHKNTLVTARAGSGKTRVIVAKVVYLIEKLNIPLDNIAIFMFNRTAAAEVNQRISNVKIDDRELVEQHRPVKVASTFHKYALDVVKATGKHPEIIDELKHNTLIRQSLERALLIAKYRPNPAEKHELLNIVSGFITRAGQRFPGETGLKKLKKAVNNYYEVAENEQFCFYHKISYCAYADYLAQIEFPSIDFNLLMHRAAEILISEAKAQHSTSTFSYIRQLKYIMIDEYQDFSYLFFALTTAIRSLAPAAKLFAVGDDWQAINRFAGSDVDYFLKFSDFFSEDNVNIPLATNYRSTRKIVDHANTYMLTNYDSGALPAKTFSRKSGKIRYRNPGKLRFDATDIKEDARNDGRFQLALAAAGNISTAKVPPNAAKLLKQVLKIIKRHRTSEIMLLHRHNFTTFDGISLETFYSALRSLVTKEYIMSEAAFDANVRCMTMHKSKGLEAKVVILLEVDHEVVASCHPHATIFSLFGDTRANESADQKRLLYVAMTRAKEFLYILSSDKHPPL